jgi:hypothetical protein
VGPIYEIKRAIISIEDVEDALRLIWSRIYTNGITPNEIAFWEHNPDGWFTDLVMETEILHLIAQIPQKLTTLRARQPRISFQFPEFHDYTPEFHPIRLSDEEPQQVQHVVIIPITEQSKYNGGIQLRQPGFNASRERYQNVKLQFRPTDILAVNGDTLHSYGPNRSAHPRAAVTVTYLTDTTDHTIDDQGNPQEL